MAAPIIAMSILSHRTTAQDLGFFVTALAIIQIATTLSDYGLSTSGILDLNRSKSRQEIYDFALKTLATKMCLAVLTTPLVVIASLTLNLSISVIFAILANIFVIALLPIFYYNFTGDFITIMKSQGVSRALYLIAIFLLVPNTISATGCLWILFISNILAAFLMLSKIIGTSQQSSRYHSFIKAINFQSIKTVVRENAPYATSRILISVVTSGNIILLSFFDSKLAVIYAMYESALRGLIGLIVEPFFNVLYPQIIKVKNLRSLAPTFGLGILTITLAGVAGIGLENAVMTVAFGNNFERQSYAMAVVSCIAMLNFISILSGFPLFGRLKEPKFANYTIMWAFPFHIIAMFLFIFEFIDVSVINFLIILMWWEILVISLRIYHSMRCRRSRLAA